VVEAAAAWFEAQLKAEAGKSAREYLKSRGVGRETATAFRLGYAPAGRTALKGALTARGVDEKLMVEAGLLVVPEDGGASFDRFRERLMFPITDRGGRVIAFGGRALGEAKAKYLNSPETPLFHKGQLLYNLAEARKPAREVGTILVAEGYMDVIALSMAGFAHAVAPLGTALTEAQIQELWRLAPEPVLCLDGDTAGRRAAYRAAERCLPLLKPGHSLRFAMLPPGEDPDSLIARQGAEAMTKTIAAATPLSVLLWQKETLGHTFSTPERRAGLRNRVRDLARTIREATVREYYLKEFDARLQAMIPAAKPGWGERAQVRPGRGVSDATGRIASPDVLDRRAEEILVLVPLNKPDLIKKS
jgi:DNA primase